MQYVGSALSQQMTLKLAFKIWISLNQEENGEKCFIYILLYHQHHESLSGKGSRWIKELEAAFIRCYQKSHATLYKCAGNHFLCVMWRVNLLSLDSWPWIEWSLFVDMICHYTIIYVFAPPAKQGFRCCCSPPSVKFVQLHLECYIQHKARTIFDYQKWSW